MTGQISGRTATLLACALVLATPLAVSTVQAHGNHVTADSQITDDGTVVVETVSSMTPGFVVLRADDGDRPGDPLGSASVARTPNLTFLTSVPVQIDSERWSQWAGNRTVWVVLHDDIDGDGEFDFGTDLSMAGRSPTASTRITVRKSQQGHARVLAGAFEAQNLADGRLTVRRVDLQRNGHVVVRPAGSNRTIGTRSLAAGSHRNVTVALDESFLADQDRTFRVRLTAYRDSGDGTFGPEDRPLTAGNQTVGTALSVEPGNESDDGPLINTPTVTSTAGPSPTPAETGSPTSSPTDQQSRVAGTDSGAESATAGPGTGGSGPDGSAGSGAGFGVTIAILAMLVALGALARTSRRW